MDNNYSVIKTEDDSLSLYSDEHEQAMHSMSGAYQESLLKHIFPSMILECPRDELYVLDIGFGIGYNILALIIEFTRKNTNRKLNIISFEKDNSIQSIIRNIAFDDEREKIYSKIKDCLSTGSMNYGGCSIQIKFGDARKSIKELNTYIFDAVFHDPYSPSKNPELWTVDFFKEIKNLMNDGAILTTYSSANQIRMALAEAGFNIYKGPSVGKKREGTLASHGNIIEGLEQIDILNLKSDIKSIPYRDYDLKDTREEIITRRISMKKAARSKRLQ